MKKSLLLFTILFFTILVQAQTWQSLGPDDSNRINVGSTNFSTEYYTSLAVNSGIPYVAYQDYSTSKIFVRKFNGTTWETLGSAAASEGQAYYSSLAFSNTSLYLAYRDVEYSSKATVKKFNGLQWETVGNSGLSASSVAYTSIITLNNTPYIAYQDAGNSNKITVQKFNGSQWEIVGQAGFSSGSALNISITTDGTGVYVSYRDEADGSKITVKKFDGTTWQNVGNAAFSPGAAYFPSIAINNGTPYVVYCDNFNSGKATVQKFNGTVWETVGSAASSGAANYTSIAFDGSVPYISFQDVANNVPAVKRFINNSWETVGATGASGTSSYGMKIVIDGGVPYVLSNLGIIEVSKYDGTAWTNLGAGKGLGSFNKPKIAIINNTPYVAIVDETAGNKATVKKYNGSSWEVVGSSGFSASVIDDITLSSYQNTLYVSYRTGQTASVQKFNGTTWELVGSGTYYTSFFSPYNPKFAFDGSNAYIVFGDRDKSDKLTVKKLNGSSWDLVGTAGFSHNVSGVPAITIDNGTPYVAYCDNDNGKQLIILKFDGVNWLQMGTAASTGLANDMSLVFDNNIPYVVYKDYNTYKYMLKKFNGTNWTDLSSNIFTSSIISNYANMAFYNHTLHLLYLEGNTGRITLKKFNGTTWQTLGSNAISSGTSMYPSLAIGSDQIAVAYYSAGLFVKNIATSTLPIKVSDFRAVETDKGIVKLSWKTSSDTDHSFFKLESSSNGKDFKVLGQLKHDNILDKYSFIDSNPLPGVNYYKLSEIEKDGTISEIGSLTIRTSNLVQIFSVYPNPITSSYLSIKDNTRSGYQNIRIFNSSGILVLRDKVQFSNGTAELRLNPNLVNGIYFLIIEDSGKNHKFLVER